MVPKIIILMGPPGSGKGTQALSLAEKFNYKHISSGNLLRVLLEKGEGTPEELAEAEKIKHGALVSDWLIFRLVFEKIEAEVNQGLGVVLDGAIRTPNQAKEFLKFFESKGWQKKVKVFWISLSDAEATQRLVNRRVCSVCNTNVPYNEETKDWQTCPKCGGQLKKRFDDKDSSIFQRRLSEQGNHVIQSIIEVFNSEEKKWGEIVKKIDGKLNIEEVFKVILGYLEN